MREATRKTIEMERVETKWDRMEEIERESLAENGLEGEEHERRFEICISFQMRSCHSSSDTLVFPSHF